MTHLVNLLPRRAARLKAQLRVWSVVLIGSQLIAPAVALNLRVTSENEALRHWQYSETALEPLLDERLRTVSALAAEVKSKETAIQRQAARLAENQRWKTRLDQLASTIPDSVWLTQLQFSTGAITAIGNALNADGLSAFSSRLWPAPGFHQPRVGAVSRNAQGHAVFTLRWPTEVNDASVH